MKFLMLSLITAATAAASVDAREAVKAQASIMDLQMELIDLRPDDGIAPSMAWISHAESSYAIAWIGRSCFDSPLCVIKRSDETLDTLSVEATGRGASASASMSATSWFASLASSSANQPGFARNVVAGAAIFDDRIHGSVVTLSPHTALSITGHYSLDVDADVGAGNSERIVYARITMKSWQHNFSDIAWFEITGGGDHANVSGEFNWYLENNLNVTHTKGGYLGISVGTQPPIPEPDTYALMLTGLGTLGIAIKRQQAGGAATKMPAATPA